ncbi:MAG: F420-dependent methylenetetrahydromethanopterin dehydrogenase [Euryarchaeota archaeon]
MAEVKAIFIKCGNLGTTMMVDMLLDERADREDVEFRILSSSVKMDPEYVEDVVQTALDLAEDFEPDFIVYGGPNPSAPGPSKAREMLAESDYPAVIIGDSPGLKVKDEMEEQGLGYILVKPDAMIGARREFLDPIEMAVYNADLVKTLAATGVLRLVQRAFDELIEKAKEGEITEDDLPRLVIDRNTLLDELKDEFENPYARAKAMAALEIAEDVADVTVEGCFMEQDKERYVPIVASAHEMMRQAAKLADEAREIEKSNDTVLRTPHAPDGTVLSKRELMEDPK